MARILRMNQLVKILGISRSSIFRLRARGDFVPAIHISTRCVGYSEDSITEWLKNRQSEMPKK